jgi:FKBP-type peptidyl-prolyl cis-trans isomerase FkpA
MKQRLFTFLLLSAAIFTSCRKDKDFQNIKEYDAEQIQGYIKANGLTAMKADDGDTSGVYYQILNPGDATKPRIEYSDRLSIAFTIRSFDGKYSTTDTIANHFNGFLGQFTQSGLPKGLQLAIFNILKYKGGSMRLLIPSRLAYGKEGYGSGSSSNTGSRIAGNQCLDYYVNVIGNQDAYDDISIQKYFAAKSLTGYTKHVSGFYYKITGSDTSTYVVKPTSKIKITYTGTILNETKFDENTSEISLNVDGLVPGFQTGIMLAKPGQALSLFIPSGLGYGQPANSPIPAASCLHFEVNLVGASDY